MKTKLFVSFLGILLFVGLFFSAGISAASGPAISVQSDKSSYRLLPSAPSKISIGGNMTSNGTPVSSGLVGVTVFEGTVGQNLRDVMFRTLPAGSVLQQSWSVNVTLGVLGAHGEEYLPQYLFNSPSTQTNPGPAFNVTFKNNLQQPLMSLYLTLTVVDAANVPIAALNVTEITTPIGPGTIASYIVPPIWLPSWAATGNATVYVSAFDNTPPNLYFPLCPETSRQFSINVNLPKQTVTPSISGNYKTALNISYGCIQSFPISFNPYGTYTVQVTGIFQTNRVTNICTFQFLGPVNISPSTATLYLGSRQNFTSTVQGISSPYTYQWYLQNATAANASPVLGATASFWVYTPPSIGPYIIYCNVTSGSNAPVKSNMALLTCLRPARLTVAFTTLKRVITQGQTQTVGILVTNTGSYTEIFNVTLYGTVYDQQWAIQTFAVTLSPAHNTTVTTVLSLTTSNYDLTATVSLKPYEINLSTAGTVEAGPIKVGPPVLSKVHSGRAIPL